MSAETEVLKTEIEARRFRSMRLSGDIDRKIRDIKGALAKHPLAKIKDIQLPLVAQLASEAMALQAQYLDLLSEIELAEKELAG